MFIKKLIIKKLINKQIFKSIIKYKIMFIKKYKIR